MRLRPRSIISLALQTITAAQSCKVRVRPQPK
jgi:hypothetical protein